MALDPNKMLKNEAQMMGRPIEYVNYQESTFSDREGVEHTVGMLVYTVEPVTFGEITMHQSRVALFINQDDRANTSAVVT